MAGNTYSSSKGGSVGTFSNLQKNQVYNGKEAFGSKDIYSSKNNFASNDTYSSKNPWRTDSSYGKDDAQEKVFPKYKRFSDLKILNENMMHMSNNTLPESTRIEILSQGEKGEIKNILSYRILQIALAPALSSLAVAAVIMFSGSLLISLFALFVYIGILVRTFFYPAKLYYENIKYKTTKPALRFFEEMDYWYKISVVNVYVYLVIVSIVIFVLSFYEEKVVSFAIKTLLSAPNTIGSGTIKNYLESISFSWEFKAFAVFNIGMLAFYSRFVNKEKSLAEMQLKERMKQIRNETLTRVQQIQADKNLHE